MDANNILNSKKEGNCGLIVKLIDIKSFYFFPKIFEQLSKKKSLEIIKYNKLFQKILNINIQDYKEYSEKYSSIK